MTNNTTKEEKWEEVKPGIWDYVNEPILIGNLIEIKTNVGPNSSKLYTIQKDDDTLLSVWGTTILDARLQFVTVGERVKVEFTGKGTPKPGRKPTLLFTVYHSLAKHEENLLEEDVQLD